MSDDVERLEEIETNSENAHIAHVCGKAAETIEALRAENEKLRAALKPFAEAAEGFRDEVSDEYPFQFGDFRLGQCRTAAAALKETGDD